VITALQERLFISHSSADNAEAVALGIEVEEHIVPSHSGDPVEDRTKMPARA
jgi:hypothetical protein